MMNPTVPSFLGINNTSVTYLGCYTRVSTMMSNIFFIYFLNIQVLVFRTG